MLPGIQVPTNYLTHFLFYIIWGNDGRSKFTDLLYQAFIEVVRVLVRHEDEIRGLEIIFPTRGILGRWVNINILVICLDLDARVCY